MTTVPAAMSALAVQVKRLSPVVERGAVPLVVGEMDLRAGRDCLKHDEGEIVGAVRVETDESDRTRTQCHFANPL